MASSTSLPKRPPFLFVYSKLITLSLAIVGISLSVFSFVSVQRWDHAKLGTQFENGAKERVLTLRQSITTNLHYVASLGALYDASESVTRNEFHRYLQPLLSRAESIQALEWVPKVLDKDRVRFEELARKEGFPNFNFTEHAGPGDMVRAQVRDSYYPVYYIEPLTGNELAFGFDLSSDLVREETLKKSRDSGKLLITERITLVQEKETQYGFLALLPVYKNNGMLLSVKDRREVILGFVLGVFRMGDILKNAMSHMSPLGIDFYLYDLSAEENTQFLAFQSALAGDPSPRNIDVRKKLAGFTFNYIDTFEVGGRKWQVIAVPSSGHFSEQIPVLSWVSLILWLVVTASLVSFVSLILSRYEQAKQYAEKIRASDELLQYQASHDELTDLVNRSEFEIRLKQALVSVQNEKTHYALLYLDLDQFKLVNDTCGHAAGDELLKKITTSLQREIRNRDTLARLGGDEFAVLLEHCSLENAESIANKLRLVVKNNRFSWEDKVFDVGVSIGVVRIAEQSTDVHQIMSTADIACYMAKDLGRNRVYTYKEEDENFIKEQGEMNWVSEVTRALDEERFELFYQAILPLDNQEYMHLEILLRMRGEDGNLIAPSHFMPAAERFGLMSDIDSMVIRESLKFFSSNKKLQDTVSLCCINLSGKSIDRYDFLENVVNEVKKSGLPPEKICFEITESAAISSLDRAITFMSTLRHFGCRFALDDFGTGMSSFNYLKKLPVDFLKIDGSFIREVDSDPVSFAMVKSIHDVGKVMEMKTIAEFVENGQIQETLTSIGIDFAQGYHIQKPAPLGTLSIPELTIVSGNESQPIKRIGDGA